MKWRIVFDDCGLVRVKFFTSMDAMFDFAEKAALNHFKAARVNDALRSV
jgi:hypothetical protein